MKSGLISCLALCAAALSAGCGSPSGDDETDPMVREFHFERTSYAESGAAVQPGLLVRMADQTVARAYDAAANPLAVTWSVDDDAVASVSAAGVVTRKSYGRTILTAGTARYSQPATTEIIFGEAVDVPAGLAGEWVLASWKGEEAMAGKVYMELTGAQSFTLYQNIDTEGFRTFRGSYSLLGIEGEAVLLGSYTDGTPMQDDYKVAVAENRLTMTALGNGDVSIYDRTTIPDWVKDGLTTASAAAVRRAEAAAGTAAETAAETGRVPFL